MVHSACSDVGRQLSNQKGAQRLHRQQVVDGRDAWIPHERLDLQVGLCTAAKVCLLPSVEMVLMWEGDHSIGDLIPPWEEARRVSWDNAELTAIKKVLNEQPEVLQSSWGTIWRRACPQERRIHLWVRDIPQYVLSGNGHWERRETSQ